MLKSMQSRKGQGTTEYIVILAIVVAIAIAVIKTNLMQSLNQKVSAVAASVSNQ